MNSQSLKRTCPVCDCAHGESLHRQTFALDPGHPLAEGYDVVVCDACGFAFADTHATQADYDRYYATQSKYADSATSTGAGQSPWDAARLQETADCIAGGVPDRSARIVDIGCANGGLLAALRAMQFTDLVGLDPSPACARETERLAGVSAFGGSLFEIPSPIGSCNGAILSHVLEHVRDLRAALASVGAHLTADGWLYVEVPDASRYEEFLFAPFQDFNTEHINHFSPQSLSNLLRSCGFTPFKCGQKTIYSWADMPYPAAWIMARKSAVMEPIAADRALADSLRRYIVNSRLLMEQLDTRISDALPCGQSVMVWGTGQLTLKLLNETSLGRASISAFIDSSPLHHGREFHSKPVIAPADIRDSHTPILIASIINQASIIETIQRLTLANPLITLVPKPVPFNPAA